MNKVTEGDWLVRETGELAAPYHIDAWLEEDERSITIATVGTMDTEPEEDRGNACLFAAAPAMLDALGLARAYLIGEMTEIDLVETVQLVDDAIAKAKGS